jgi:hypothetical protein
MIVIPQIAALDGVGAPQEALEESTMTNNPNDSVKTSAAASCLAIVQ